MFRTRLSCAAGGLLGCAIVSAILSGPLQAGGTILLSERLSVLKQSYPDLIYSITNNTIRLMDNRNVVVDDGIDKRLSEKHRNADLEDQLSQIYPIGKCYKGRKPDRDPGLIRSDAFLRGAYGANEYQVKQTTQTIDWFGTPLRFSTRHGAARALRRVLGDLKRLPPGVQAAVRKPARAFDWGRVPNTDRLDVHSFGIAIDLSPDIRDRWRLLPGPPPYKVGGYSNRIPQAVVAAFERHGFIWGGKWYYFDTGHFEYRPAMIALARLAEKRGCEK